MAEQEERGGLGPGPEELCEMRRRIAGWANRFSRRAAGSAGERRFAEHLAGRLASLGMRVALEPVPLWAWQERAPARVDVREGDWSPIACAASPYSDRTPPEGALGTAVALDPEAPLPGMTPWPLIGVIAPSGEIAAFLRVRPSGPPVPMPLPSSEDRRVVVTVAADAASRLAGREVRVVVRGARVRRTAVSVVADLAPDRPGRRVPHVVLGAHLDAVGAGPGAVDNLSGIAAMLDAAAALAARRPPGGVRVVAFGAEEANLAGARAHVRALRLAGAPPQAMINLDSVGAGDRWILECGPLPFQVRLRGMSAELAARSGRPARWRAPADGGDHHPFLAAGVPVASLAGWPHPAMHTALDTADRVDAASIWWAGWWAERAVRVALEGAATPPGRQHPARALPAPRP